MSKADKDIIPILSKNLFPVVGIGASAGGLEAFKKLVSAIPQNSGMAYILVQHLHPDHESSLPEILQRVSKIPVIEISENLHVNPNHIYVIPSNKILVATDGILKLNPRSAEERQILSIDIFLSSLAEVHQAHAIGVILSGTGADGTMGLKNIKDYGGLTFAQYPASASYDSMPQHAIDAGVVDFILLPEKMPEKLIELQKPFITLSTGDELDIKDETEDGFRQIIALLKVRVGVDFSLYKQTTVRRRITRRMVMLHQETIPDYLDHLRKNKPEQDILFQDLLIPVTSFFRDPLTFSILCETVFPEVVKNLPTGQAGLPTGQAGISSSNPLRIWVAACSTGQEAYSIAMCCHEYLSDHISNIKVQIFATDLSEKAIKKARGGIYTKKELDGISGNRLNQFFVKSNGHYEVKKPIRDMCVFAVHNFLKDPPFAKLDFISCRNVLIYLEPFLQKKALSTFHYALNERGILLLGKSETTGSSSDLFSPFGKKDKFYIRKSVPGRFANTVIERNQTLFSIDKNYFSQSKGGKIDDFQKSADDILLSRYAPVGVVVNEQFDIVQFRGFTGEYLEPSPGKASLNVLKMAKEGLAFEIRNALHKAKTTGEPLIKEGIAINKGTKLVIIEVIPLLNTLDLHFLILFKQAVTVESPKKLANKKDKGNILKYKEDERDIRILQLENELAQAREDMRDITEEQEAANEELQSGNEELLSGSEELQSLNEELETSKEELQSTNEELITVNQELFDRNEELNQSRKFAEATISILHEPLLVLDRNFRIKSANTSFYKIFQLTEDETLGKILFELHNNSWDIPVLRKELGKIQKEKEMMIEVEIVFTLPVLGERIVCFNIQPIHSENGDQLILLALDDITLRKNAGQAEMLVRKQLEQNAKMIERLYMNSPAFICTLNGPTHIYDLVNPSYQKIFGNRELLGKPVMKALPELEGQGFDKILDNVYLTGDTFLGIEVPIWLARDEGLLPELRYFNLSYQPIYNENNINGIVAFGYEVTEEIRGKKIQEESAERFRILTNVMPQKMWTADANGNVDYLNQQWFDFTHKSFEELKGKGWEKIIHPDDWSNNQQIWQHSINTGEDFELEHRFLCYDGTYHWHLSRGLAQKDENGKVLVWIGNHTDINEQKKFAEELKMQIEERIKLDAQKNNFISMASHELKTPVTSIKGYTQVLKYKFNKDGNVEAEAFLAKMDKQINRLTSLINDLLDSTKVTEGRLAFTEELFDFNDLVTEIVEEMQQTSQSLIIHLNLDTTEMIFADRNRIGQVITNMLSNAIKYSPNADNIIVSTGHKNKNIKFCVEDFGIGIPKESQTNLFDQFYRVSGLEQDTFSGLGLGLFIASEIIKRHKGKMSVESVEGKGSTFCFTLPVKDS